MTHPSDETNGALALFCAMVGGLLGGGVAAVVGGLKVGFLATLCMAPGGAMIGAAAGGTAGLVWECMAARRP